MTTLSQNEIVLDWLTDYPEMGITQLQATTSLGVLRLAARISELRRDGHHITAEMVAVSNRYGRKVHVARYRLLTVGRAA